MTPQEFQNLSLSNLESLTGIRKCTWSLYFNGHRSMTLRTLGATAEKLGMERSDLLVAIQSRCNTVEAKRKEACRTT